MPTSYAHLCNRDEAPSEYERLKKSGLLNQSLKPMPVGDKIAIPVLEGDLEFDFQEVEKHNPHNQLAEILPHPPRRWEKLGDMVIFPQGTDTTNWPIEKVTEILRANKIGIQNEIDPGVTRKSQLELVHGEDGWVVHRENYVEYEFDATEVMFSSGNVTERRRMSEIQAEGETIVDAFCGIGYYTLQLLVHGKAKQVHACEINPHSIIALEKGLARNGVSERCTIHAGDNRVSMKELRGVADRVILGLIPSSMNSWASAIRCLKDSGGIIHVHMNVHEDEIDNWSKKTTEWFSTASGKNVIALHLEVVKKYSPHIMHVVLDLEFD